MCTATNAHIIQTEIHVHHIRLFFFLDPRIYIFARFWLDKMLDGARAHNITCTREKARKKIWLRKILRGENIIVVSKRAESIS